MDLKDLVEVGKVNKPHGVRGILRVTFNFPLSSFNGVPFTAIFIGKGATQLPHFVTLCEDLGDSCLLTLEEIDSREKALSFANKPLSLPRDVYEKAFDIEEDENQFLEGYTIIDQDDNTIGQIKEIVEFPSQDMALVIYNGAEVMIPLIDELIIVVDEEQRIIQMENSGRVAGAEQQIGFGQYTVFKGESNKVSAYIIFGNDYKGNIQLKAFDNKGLEMGDVLWKWRRKRGCKILRFQIR